MKKMKKKKMKKMRSLGSVNRLGLLLFFIFPLSSRRIGPPRADHLDPIFCLL
jgi:hypothetical protein